MVFPTFLRYQQVKISASGQEIGGDILFKRRIGFSGTPSSLLPLEMGETLFVLPPLTTLPSCVHSKFF